jgi:hypothetical protein
VTISTCCSSAMVRARISLRAFSRSSGPRTCTGKWRSLPG